jgi:bifunctional non-homologous end joining protein LigD
MPQPRDPEPIFPPAGLWSTATILPEQFLPMLATTASGPLDSADFGYEVKWDGLRVLVGLEGKGLVLRTAAGQDASFWLPDLASVRAAAEPEWVLLDGEVIVMERGKPSHSRLQGRLQAADGSSVARLTREAPATLIVYDILRIGNSWLLDVSWEERRDILSRAVVARGNVRIPPAYRGGTGALDRARELGLEAVVGKRLRGRYSPGERTRDWLNIKPLEEVEAVVCGWTEGRGARSDTIGTLLLGAFRGGELAYVGHTGTGLDAETLRVLHADLLAGEQPDCPFREVPALPNAAHWVRPEIVCRIRHHGWTDAGKVRSATFVARVGERAPDDCCLPGAEGGALRAER